MDADNAKYDSGLRLKHYLSAEHIEQKSLAKNLGRTPQYVNAVCAGRTSIGKKLASTLQDMIGVNAGWLLTGQGSMYVDEPPSSQASEGLTPYAVAPQQPDQPHQPLHSRPYFNVDFAASFTIMANDQTTNPDYLIDFPPYRDCDFYCNVYGDSMSPTISSGDIVAMKRIEDFRYLINGKIYGIITSNGLRTIKRIRDNGDTFTLVPDNPTVGEQTIPKSLVTNVFLVLGSIKQF